MRFGSANSQVTMISVNDVCRVPTSITKIKIFFTALLPRPTLVLGGLESIVIIRSQRNVALRNIEAIAVALKISMSELFEGI